MLEALFGLNPVRSENVGHNEIIRITDIDGVQANLKDAGIVWWKGRCYVLLGNVFKRYDPSTGITESFSTNGLGSIVGGLLVATPTRLLLMGGFINGVGSNKVYQWVDQGAGFQVVATITGLGAWFSEMKGFVSGDYVYFTTGRFAGPTDNSYFLSFNHTTHTLWGITEPAGKGGCIRSAVVTDGSFIYRLGGIYTKSGRVPTGDIYSWPLGASSPKPVFVTTAPKPFSDAIAYCIKNKIVILGVYHETTGTYSKSRMIYDIKANTWEEYDRGDDPALWGAASCHDGGYLYSFFGSTPPALPQNKEVYRLQMLD